MTSTVARSALSLLPIAALGVASAPRGVAADPSTKKEWHEELAVFEKAAKAQDERCSNARSAVEDLTDLIAALKKKIESKSEPADVAALDEAQRQLSIKENVAVSACAAAAAAWRKVDERYGDYTQAFRWSTAIVARLGYGKAADSAFWNAALALSQRVDNHYWSPALMVGSREDGSDRKPTYFGLGLDYFKTYATAGPGVGFDLLLLRQDGDTVQKVLRPHAFLAVAERAGETFIAALRCDLGAWIPLKHNEAVGVYVALNLGLGFDIGRRSEADRPPKSPATPKQ